MRGGANVDTVAANSRNEGVCLRKIILGFLGSCVLSMVFASVAFAADLSHASSRWSSNSWWVVYEHAQGGRWFVHGPYEAAVCYSLLSDMRDNPHSDNSVAGAGCQQGVEWRLRTRGPVQWWLVQIWETQWSFDGSYRTKIDCESARRMRLQLQLPTKPPVVRVNAFDGDHELVFKRPTR